MNPNLDLQIKNFFMKQINPNCDICEGHGEYYVEIVCFESPILVDCEECRKSH